MSNQIRVPGGWGSQILRQLAHEGGKVVSLKHLPPLPPGNIPGTHFWKRLGRPQGHNAAGRIMSMKNSNDTIGNRFGDLPVCSAVNQIRVLKKYNEKLHIFLTVNWGDFKITQNTSSYKRSNFVCYLTSFACLAARQYNLISNQEIVIERHRNNTVIKLSFF
jgi:hypothetical protein